MVSMAVLATSGVSSLGTGILLIGGGMGGMTRPPW